MRTPMTAMALILISSVASEARIINVPDDLMTIQLGIDASQNGDTVLVQPGRYFENINFNGRSITLGSLFLTTGDDDFIARTVIDGMANGRSAVVMRAGEQAVFTGFTLQNASTDFGGGIYCRSSRPTFSHLIVENNVVTRNGAGIYCTQGTVALIHDVVIRNNHAGYVGAGFGCFGGSTITIRDSEIYDNIVDHAGAGVHCHSSQLTLDNVTITGNSASHFGGGVYLTQSARVMLVNSICWDDTPQEVYFGVWGDTLASDIDIFFSLIDGGEEDIGVFADSEARWWFGNITDDPLFVDAENHDYRLTADSPCIDAASPARASDPDGTRADIGRHHFPQEDGGSFVRRVPEDYDTMQEAIDDAEDGDVVFVQPDEYMENIILPDGVQLCSRYFTTGDPAMIGGTVIDGDDNGSVVAFEEDGNSASVLGFTITGGRAENGGGILLAGAGGFLSHVIVRANVADELGGGIYFSSENNEHQLSLTDSEINENNAGAGAGIYIRGDAAIRTTTVSGNRGEEAGGGIFIDSSDPLLENVMVFSNTADDGGGIYCSAANPSIEWSLIIANISAAQGPALFLLESSPSLLNVSLNRNISEWDGRGGIFVGAGSLLRVRNSILWENADREVEIEEGAISISYTDITRGEDGVANDGGQVEWGEGNFDADPQFLDVNNSDYRLSEISPCIDAGDPESARDPDGTRADIGAYYYHQDIQNAGITLYVPEQYQTIQEAIDASFNGDTILVSPGRYEENLDFQRKNVILGSYYMRTGQSSYIEETVIDGGGNGPVMTLNGGQYSTCVIMGLTITGGAGEEGGGIYCLYSSPTIERCVITGNRVETGAAGVYCYAAGPRIINTTISGNASQSGGGAVGCWFSAYPYIENSILWGNEPNEIYFFPERDPNGVTVAYSCIEGGEDGVDHNNNGNAYWDDGNIDQNPRFVDPNNRNYRLAENSPCIDAGDPDAEHDPDGSTADMGSFYFERSGAFRVPLQESWTMISSVVIPPDPDIIGIWSDVVARGRLVLTKNQDGEFYFPELEFNNIPGWDHRYGYQVKMTEPDTLVMEGILIVENAPIPLREGWSIVAYFPEQEMIAQDAFAGIEDDLYLVKDYMGRFYYPAMDFSNMEPLTRGWGYQVKVDEEVELVWPQQDNAQSAEFSRFENSQPPLKSHFGPVPITGSNMSVLLNAECRMKNAEYFEVGVFTEDGLGVGSSKFKTQNSNFKIGFAVWGDDPTTLERDGAAEGEALRFVVWDGEREIPLQATWLQGDGVYLTDALAIGTLTGEPSIPLEFNLAKPFPNPFNARVTLDYTLPERTKASLAVHDVTGRLVDVVRSGMQAAGRYRAAWDASSQPSGVYFVRLSTTAESRCYKMALIR